MGDSGVVVEVGTHVKARALVEGDGVFLGGKLQLGETLCGFGDKMA